jgi:hypothetical protein
MKLAVIYALIIFPLLPGSAQETYTVTGTITDIRSGQPLPSANIRIHGTTRGTVSNRDGDFQIPLSEGSHTIIVSYIGYRSDTTRVNVPERLVHNVSLQSTPIVMPEVVVTDEDPAIEIIRKAIENKSKWMGELKSFIGNAFTRDKFIRNDEINTISEAYSDVYWHREYGIREIAQQRRQSANLPDEFQLARMGEIVNFNDDEIELLDFRFIGVTAPEALRYYDYKLTGIRTMDDIEIYDIRILPKTRLQPLFNGRISIADETYAVVEVDLEPNEALHVPIIQQLHAQYRQQFRLYDERFWMPTNFQFDAGFSFSLPGLRIGEIRYEKAAVMYEYEINATIPDTVFEVGETFSIAEGAAKFDSTFWAERNVLPLTPDEIQAYGRIDSIVTHGGEQRNNLGWLEVYLRPLQYLDARFNRAEGFYVGGKIELDRLSRYVRLNGSAGYGFSDRTWKYSAGGTLYPTQRHIVGLGGELFRKTASIPKEQHFGSLAIAAAALFDKNDYLDYYMKEGWRSFFELNIRRGPRYRRHTTRIELGYTDEKHRSIRKKTDFSIFYRSRFFRENPLIDEGRLRGFTLHAERRASNDFFLLPAGFRWEVSLEHSSPSLTGSDFDFTRLFATAQGRFNTMYQRHALSPVLSYFIAGGRSTGSVPVQRLFELDSDLSGLATVGSLRGVRTKEFAGDRFLQISLEHNFRRIPFLALGIPFLYEMGLELLVHGSVARSWMGDPVAPEYGYLPESTNGWYSEIGLGLGKLFQLLRIDFTWRITDPGGFHVTFGLSELL